MKNIKIYATVPGAVVINITNNNAYSGKPYITITDKDNIIMSFYSKEDYDAYLTYRAEQA